MGTGYPKPIRKGLYRFKNICNFFLNCPLYYFILNCLGFDGIPNSVDAAFVWSGNGLIYFFKNGDYYRFDPEERPPVKNTYPKPISNWEGIPNNIDDALKYTN